MASNPLPPNPGALIVLAGKCENGLTLYATTLNITQITVAGLQADAAALSTAMTDFNATRAARTAAHAQLQQASAGAKKFIDDAKRVLSSHWGNDWSQAVQLRATSVNPAGESVPSAELTAAVA